MIRSTKTETETIELQNFGRASLSEFLDNWVIYRNLEPLDKRVAGLKRAYYRMELKDSRIPRKLDPDYAKAAIWLLNEIQRVRGVRQPLTELLMVGDTLSGDGRAFANMQERSGWQAACIIVGEVPEQKPLLQAQERDHPIMIANRWSLLADWAAMLIDQGFRLDSSTALIVDLDKTAIGARGRNDRAIDKARLDGIYRTMDAVLGDNFDKAAFERDYNRLNRPEFHDLTEDNQDYLGYICLVLNGCVTDLEELIQEVNTGSLISFEHFIRWIEARITFGNCASENLRQAHEAVLTSVRAGDPTPFKRFRRQEFVATYAHMDSLADDVAPAERMQEEITITQEVRELSLWLRSRGCLLVGMSDKPDEASYPDARAAANLPAIHQAVTHVVGTSIQAALEGLNRRLD